MRHVYFPGLNAIRFYAALSVVIYHLDNNPHYWFGEPLTASLLSIPFLSGGDAVTLFFVLSGFLITYLLLDEKVQTYQVSVRAFYLRRVLRIWPLYYVVAFAGMLILPIPPTDQFRILTLLANVSFIFGSYGVLGHLWSISVEEQFYLAWPWLVKVSNHIVRALVTLLVLKLLLNEGVRFILPALPANSGQALYSFLLHTRFECMIIGGLGAVIVYRYPRILRAMHHRAVEVGVLLIVVLVVLQPDHVVLSTEALSVFFALFIVNTATNRRALLRVESRLTTTLGNMSYAIYMVHPLVLYMVWSAMRPLALPQDTHQLMFYGGTIGLTLAIAYVSYRYLEKPFLRLKARYQTGSTPTASSPAPTVAAL